MQPAFFLAGNRARDDVDVVVLKNMFTSTTSLHKDFVTVVLDSFLVNCFEKIVMATNSSGLSSNYLLVSEERRKRERREREQELRSVELAKGIAKENVSGIDRGGEIAAKKDAKRNGLGQEKTDEGDGKENCKYKENGSQTVAF